MRADAVQYKGQTDSTAYEESVKLANEVATVLRRNFVQAQRVASDDGGRWSEYGPSSVVPCLTFS